MTKLPNTARLAIVGFICAQWALIEEKFAKAIWFLLGVDEEVGKIVTGGLDIRPRMNMAIRLAQKIECSPELLAGLEESRRLIQDGLAQRRNLVVHGVHNSNPTEGALLLELHRGRNLEPQEFSDESLKQLSDDLDAVSQILSRALYSELERLGSLKEPLEQFARLRGMFRRNRCRSRQGQPRPPKSSPT